MIQFARMITRPIWILSLVSLFSDITSEMIYPIMPMYLESIGFTILWIGMLEGLAEAIAGLSQGYFGKASDMAGKRMPFIRLGYALTALSKPIIGFFKDPILIFMARSADRFGKGIRTGARDALLSSETSHFHKGSVFGFHRSMNTIGAVIGLLCSLGFLYYRPGEYQSLFLISAFPALVSVVLTFFVSDTSVHNKTGHEKESAFSFLHYWGKSSIEYKKLVIGLLIFTLFNASDFFLLLKMKHDGLDDVSIISIYIFYNLVYAVTALPIGIIADRVGLKAMLLLGLMSYALLYGGMAMLSGATPFYGLFFLYGIYSASTEGISKAWISNICDQTDLGTALGLFHGMQSVMLMCASIAMGILWTAFGPETTFLIIGVVTLLVLGYCFTLKNPRGAFIETDNPDPLKD